VCRAEAGLSLLLVFNQLPRLSLFPLHALHLSQPYGGQAFMAVSAVTRPFELGGFGLERNVIKSNR
jgi:hypothetical protein